MTFDDFEEKVLFWARVRGLDEGNPRDQYLKVIEESIYEISEGTLIQDRRMIIDAIGDTAVTLVILKAQLEKLVENKVKDDHTGFYTNQDSLFYAISAIAGNLARSRYDRAYFWADNSLKVLRLYAKDCQFDFNKCCEVAWDEIKDRNGMLVNGIFIKEEDFTDEQKKEFELRNN